MLRRVRADSIIVANEIDYIRKVNEAHEESQSLLQAFKQKELRRRAAVMAVLISLNIFSGEYNNDRSKCID